MQAKFKPGSMRVGSEDGAAVTNLDDRIRDAVIEYYAHLDVLVYSREKGTAKSSDREVMVFAPLDALSDVIEGPHRQPPASHGAVSLGMLTQSGLEAGAICFALLDPTRPPVLYGGGPSLGAFRQVKGRREPLQVDATPTTGIVFVSSTAPTDFRKRLSGAGFTPVALYGTAFKGCALIDPWLRKYRSVPGLGRGPSRHVVGFVTHAPSDALAGIAPIARGAGAIVTASDDGKGWIMANNPATYDQLSGIVQG